MTPVSEWLAHLLRPLFYDQFTIDEEYIEGSERAEVTLGALSQDASTQMTPEGKFGPGPRWYGRATWPQRYSRTNPVGRLQEVLRKQGQEWPLVRGGPFGGDQTRTRAALALYAENLATETR